MESSGLEEIARALVADGKGILAIDETPRTITRRLAARGIESTPDSRRAYRELLFCTPGAGAFIAGAILQDETIRQVGSTGAPLVESLVGQAIIPGIKVDEGTTSLAGAPGELVTEGLDGLRERLDEYRGLGARFAKWRAVFHIGEGMPSGPCLRANAHALARYAALCQEQGLVPIVEPEVLMTGGHSLERCQRVTARVLHAVFDELFDQDVELEAMLLKPNMAIAGQSCDRLSSANEVAEATLRILRGVVPPAVSGIVFLSGGQDPVQATENLNAINLEEGPTPWPLSFSFGRALQDEALAAWDGRSENILAGQRAFLERARSVSAAALGQYTGEQERSSAAEAP